VLAAATAASNPAVVTVIASSAEIATAAAKATVTDRKFKERRLPGTKEEGIIRSGTWTKPWARPPSPIASSYYY